MLLLMQAIEMVGEKSRSARNPGFYIYGWKRFRVELQKGHCSDTADAVEESGSGNWLFIINAYCLYSF